MLLIHWWHRRFSVSRTILDSSAIQNDVYDTIDNDGGLKACECVQNVEFQLLRTFTVKFAFKILYLRGPC